MCRTIWWSRFFDLVPGEASVWLSAMTIAVPLYSTVALSCVLHGLRVMTTASFSSLSLSPFKLPLECLAEGASVGALPGSLGRVPFVQIGMPCWAPLCLDYS